jgi:hypothetical protein
MFVVFSFVVIFGRSKTKMCRACCSPSPWTWTLATRSDLSSASASARQHNAACLFSLYLVRANCAEMIEVCSSPVVVVVVVVVVAVVIVVARVHVGSPYLTRSSLVG